MTSEVLTADSKGTQFMGPSLAIFLGGAAVGAIAALLLAPQAGRESRKQLSEYGRCTGETISEWATATSGLFATGKNVKEAAQEASRTPRERDEVVKPPPAGLAH